MPGLLVSDLMHPGICVLSVSCMFQPTSDPGMCYGMVCVQERAAKAAVQLPYEHQGAGGVAAVADARQYLPPAAGGFGPGAEDQLGSGKLGHILYVRDSEEEHDSDEDPDDDLDWV